MSAAVLFSLVTTFILCNSACMGPVKTVSGSLSQTRVKITYTMLAIVYVHTNACELRKADDKI